MVMDKVAKTKKKQKFSWKTVGLVLALCAWVIVCLVAFQFIVSYVMVALLGEAVNQPVWSAVYSAVVYGLTLVVVIFVPWRIKKMKTSREELGLSGLPTWTDILLTPVGFFVYYIIAILVAALAATIFPNVNWQQAQEVGFQNLFLTSDKILAFIALVVVAPIAEEIVFRGWLYGKIRSKVPAWVGILAVSAVFGIMHLGFDLSALQWNVAINVFCMSVVMCIMREITGTIWSGILLHVLKNGVAFYLLFISGMFY